MLKQSAINQGHRIPCISPVSTRKLGGGYEAFDPDMKSHRKSYVDSRCIPSRVAKQVQRLCRTHSVDLTPIEDIVRVLRDDKTIAAE